MKRLLDLATSELKFNGVYKIINIINNKCYVGSCASKRFLGARLLNHRIYLLNNTHKNRYLQNAVNKYSIENFYYEILEICSSQNCIEREQFYIDTLKPEYNIRKIAESNLGIKITGQSLENMRTAFKNRSPEIIAKSIKQCLVMSKNNQKEIWVIDVTDDCIYEFSSIKETAESLNIPKTNIQIRVQRKLKSLVNNKWAFYYKKEIKN